MIVQIPDFDISKIAESGQCFRMTENIDGSYGLIHKGKYLEISQVEDDNNTDCVKYNLSCTEKDYENIWKDYFDLSFNYEKIRLAADVSDDFLIKAIDFGRGIRILQQDPWEMLISFIISQRKSIPAIRTSIEKLCAICGDAFETPFGTKYSFPNPEQIATLSIEQLDSCSLGYRSKYLADAAKKVISGELDVYSLSSLSDDDLRNSLLELFGVGIKVANCVMLFGYHRLDAFPADVWIKRALESEYPDGFPYDKYTGFGGIMQQYIFFYMRSGS